MQPKTLWNSSSSESKEGKVGMVGHACSPSNLEGPSRVVGSRSAVNSNPAKVRTLSQPKQTIKEDGKQKDRGGGRNIDTVG